MENLQETVYKFCDKLDNTFQCIFCRASFGDKPIYSCESGHNVCSECKVEFCVACKLPKKLIRNHLAGELVKLFMDLKDINDVIHGDNGTNDEQLNDQENVDNDEDTSDEISVADTVELDKPRIPTHIYRCLNKYCRFEGQFKEILRHYMTIHSSQYEDVKFDTFPYTKSWKLTYTGNNSQQIRMFDIGKFRLFVLHIFMNNDGEMKASILLYDRRKFAIKYQYKLIIESGNHTIFQRFTEVDTCRIPNHKLFHPRNGLFISKGTLLYHELKSKLEYKCTVIIKFTNAAENKDINSQKQADSTGMGRNNMCDQGCVNTPGRYDKRQRNLSEHSGDHKKNRSVSQPRRNNNNNNNNNNGNEKHLQPARSKSVQRTAVDNKLKETPIPSFFDFKQPSTSTNVNANAHRHRNVQPGTSLGPPPPNMYPNLNDFVIVQSASQVQFSQQDSYSSSNNKPSGNIHPLSPLPPTQNDFVYQQHLPPYSSPNDVIMGTEVPSRNANRGSANEWYNHVRKRQSNRNDPCVIS